MIRDLHLIRHAKSSWDDPHLSDHDRPLNTRGLSAAPLMGRAMAQRVSGAPTFFVSSARRARETYTGLSKGWPMLTQAPVSEERALYTFLWSGLRDWLSQCDDGLDNIALIGHNPAMTDFINHLCPSLELDNLPTAGWIWLRFEDVSWSEAAQAVSFASAMASLRPKALVGEAP